MTEGISATPRLSLHAASSAMAPVATPVVMVDLDFATGPVRVWSGVGPLHWAGLVFEGVGALGAVSDIEETTEIRAVSLTLTLSPVPQEVVDIALAERSFRMRRAMIWGALLTPEGAFVADPFPLWAGLMDTMEIVDGEQPRVSLTCESRLVGGADGGRVLVRCFDASMTVRENIAGDVLGSLTTMLWNSAAKAWTAGAPMADASLNRRGTFRLGPSVAFAQIGLVGFDGAIEIEALRLYGLPEHAPALLCGTPALPVGKREFTAEVTWDLPSLAAGATQLLDVTVTGCRQGDLALASFASSTRFIELEAECYSNNIVRVVARNVGSAFDPDPATLSVTTIKRRVP